MTHAIAPFEQGNHCKGNVYGMVDGRRVDIGRMDRAEDAEFLVKAGNAYGQPCPFDEDLREGLQQSERRRRIAAVVATHHQRHIAGFGTAVLVPRVLAAFECVLAALGGAVDPNVLGVAEDVLAVEQVRGIVTSTSGEAARG